MIRVENSLNSCRNIGPYSWKSPFVKTGSKQSQINQMPLAVPRTDGNWSGYGVLPSIRTSGNQSLANTEIKTGQSYIDLTNFTKVTSYSQLRAQWLMVKNSKSIPQATKDQIHEIYLDETTNQLNRLVFGDPLKNVMSVCPKPEVGQPSGDRSENSQRPGMVPKPPAYPRACRKSNTRRYRRIVRVDSSHGTSLGPVMEYPSPRPD